jgi:uncharacterized membrane protein YbaN (DUF454 family)
MQEIGVTKTQKLPQRVTIIALSWIVILGGIVGLFIPVLPGGVLIFTGALMLSPHSTLLRRMLEKCRMRFPLLERASSSLLKNRVLR